MFLQQSMRATFAALSMTTVCNHISKQTLEIVPDSGATAHMLILEEFFEGDYQRCTDVSVLMGDGTRVPVHGIGIACISIGIVCVSSYGFVCVSIIGIVCISSVGGGALPSSLDCEAQFA